MKHYKLTEKELIKFLMDNTRAKTMTFGEVVKDFLKSKTSIEINQDNNRDIVIEELTSFLRKIDDELCYVPAMKDFATDLLAKLSPLDRGAVELAVASESSYNPERTDRMVDKICSFIPQQQTLDRESIIKCLNKAGMTLTANKKPFTIIEQSHLEVLIDELLQFIPQQQPDKQDTIPKPEDMRSMTKEERARQKEYELKHSEVIEFSDKKDK